MVICVERVRMGITQDGETHTSASARLALEHGSGCSPSAVTIDLGKPQQKDSTRRMSPGGLQEGEANLGRRIANLRGHC